MTEPQQVSFTEKENFLVVTIFWFGCKMSLEQFIVDVVQI